MMAEEDHTGSIPSHLLVELTSLAELSFPTTASSRIKYTCVCASPHFVAVGSSSGTLYLFSRYAAKNRKSLCNVPVQVIPCQEGAITLVEISPDEKSVAVATSRGFLCVLNISRNHSTTILNNVLHVGAEITCFRFTHDGARLFAGDSLGRVSCNKLFSKLLLRSPCEMLLRLDSRVVQIDSHHSQLLVSTLSRCYLHNVARQTTCQIGSKLRNGIYGACFFSSSGMENGSHCGTSCTTQIFCARPGGRLWEVDDSGKVYSTHQFAGIKNKWGVPGIRDFNAMEADSTPSVTFGAVRVVGEFLLSASGGVLIVVDPKRAKLVLVADVGEEIVQYSVCANDVFLLNSDGYLRKVTLFPLEKAVEKLHIRERFVAAAQVVCAVHHVENRCPIRMDIIRTIRTSLDGLTESAALVKKLDEIILEESNKTHDNVKNVMKPQVARLASGIHKVVKGMESSGYEDDFTFRVPSYGKGIGLNRDWSPYNCLTRRSKSVSSVNEFVVAVGANGGSKEGQADSTGQLYDPRNIADGQYESAGESDFGCPMAVSRSENSLLSLMQPHSETGDCSERPAGVTVNSEYSPIMENGEDTLAVLKDTLRTGGRLLTDVVQKMSLLNMGPDFADPTFLVNNENGFYYRDEEEKVRSEKAQTPVAGSTVVYAHAISNGDDGTVDHCGITTKPVVKRVARASSKSRMGRVQKACEKNVRIATMEKKKTRENASEVVKNTGAVAEQSGEKTIRCESCGLHNTWRFALTVGPFVAKLNLNSHWYESGGVPTSVASWRDLLSEWKRRRRVSSSAELCSSCARLFLQHSALSSPPATPESNGLADVVSSALDHFPDSLLVRVFRRTDLTERELSDSQSTLRGSQMAGADQMEMDVSSAKDAVDESAMAISMYYNPLYDSVYNPDETADGGNGGMVIDVWWWLTSSPLDILLNMAAKIIGFDAMMEIVLDVVSDYQHEISGEFYANAAVQNPRWVLDDKVLKCVATNIFNLSDAILEEMVKDEQSVRINANGFCPCCTLPVTSTVAERNRRVYIFPCDHGYHEVCLMAHTSPPYSCLVCTMASQ